MRTDAIPHGYRTSRLRTLLSWAGVIVAALAISALFKAFIGAAYAIPSGSMEGTLQIGDRIWAERLSYAPGDEPVAGDIVRSIRAPSGPYRRMPSPGRRSCAPGPSTASARWAERCQTP